LLNRNKLEYKSKLLGQTIIYRTYYESLLVNVENTNFIVFLLGLNINNIQDIESPISWVMTILNNYYPIFE
jgi:hypothetical protein